MSQGIFTDLDRMLFYKMVNLQKATGCRRKSGLLVL